MKLKDETIRDLEEQVLVIIFLVKYSFSGAILLVQW